jgi:hypothetical protein
MKSLKNTALIVSILIMSAKVLTAQTDFSGTWIIDHSKSDAEFRDYEITCIIGQTSQTFTVEQTLIMKDGQKTAMPALTYKLDGKEVTKEEQGGKEKLSATWSEDKKTLTVTFVRSMNGNDYGSKTSYSLSENGQFLKINSSDLTGESPMVQVYKKK